jgi:hypothetical protein
LLSSASTSASISCCRCINFGGTSHIAPLYYGCVDV